MENFVNRHVATYFHEHDYNCVRTDLLILAKHFKVELQEQILAAAIGMHGAGGYRAQCGLVEGTLLFLGIIGVQRNVPEEKIVSACHDFGQEYEKAFTSLQCSTLRPGGFNDDDPPHLCEELACRSALFSIRYIEKVLKIWEQ